MITEEQDIRNKIHRFEDKLLRSKDFNEQLRLHQVLQTFNRELANVIYKKETRNLARKTCYIID